MGDIVVFRSSLINSMEQEEELKAVPLLVFANKQDQPGALSVAEVPSKMLLVSFCFKLERNWQS